MTICQPKHCFCFISIEKGLILWSLFDLLFQLTTWVVIFQCWEKTSHDAIGLPLTSLLTFNILINLFLMVGMVRRQRSVLVAWQWATILSTLGYGGFSLFVHLQVSLDIHSIRSLKWRPYAHRSTVASACGCCRCWCLFFLCIMDTGGCLSIPLDAKSTCLRHGCWREQQQQRQQQEKIFITSVTAEDRARPRTTPSHTTLLSSNWMAKSVRRAQLQSLGPI